jgi:hypothetical protein
MRLAVFVAVEFWLVRALLLAWGLGAAAYAPAIVNIVAR